MSGPKQDSANASISCSEKLRLVGVRDREGSSKLGCACISWGMICASITESKDFWQLSGDEVSSESVCCSLRLGCAPEEIADNTK